MRVLRAGLIGDHISQTRLPAALDIMCRANGVALEFELIDTAGRPDFEFFDCVEGLQAAGWSGVTVTHPYKADAAAYAGDAMAVDLRRLGAANTLLFGSEVIGFNTDFTGFLSAWRSEMTVQAVGRVAMAGAGGVARALGPALAELGAERITIWDVSEDRATELASMIGPTAQAIPADSAGDAIRKADGLVNATPLGMAYHPGTAFPEILIEGQSWVFDAVYTPTDTSFLKSCAASNLKILSGFDLFRHMAIRSFEAYTGISPDPEQVLPKLQALRPQ